MAQPKKLTHKEKQRKKLLQQLSIYIEELKRIKIGMKKQPDDTDTWRWAALEIHKELAKLGNCEEINKYKDIALDLARQAQNVFR